MRTYFSTRSQNPKLLPGLDDRKCVHNYATRYACKFRPIMLLGGLPLQKIFRRYWLSASHLRNYVMKDTISDWVRYSNSRRPGTNGFMSFLSKKGIDFEKTVVQYIDHNIAPVKRVGDDISKDNIDRVEQLMREGAPIIWSVPFAIDGLRIRGVMDLLVRSDYLHKMTEVASPVESHGCDFSDEWHYVVVDVKFSTLKLNSDGIHLSNCGNSLFYKTQVMLYTRALGRLQGYEPRFAYILGRRTGWTSKGIKTRVDKCFNRLGVVDFQGNDEGCADLLRDSIKWVRDVKANGSKWKVGEHPSLWPNMCVQSIYQKEKQRWAEKLGEITTIWQCGYKHRRRAIEQGVSSWRDPKFCSELVGLSGKRGKIIDTILEANRTGEIIPERMKSGSWQDGGFVDVYIDFETMIDIFCPLENIPHQWSSEMIFMIGAWHDGKYLNWTADRGDEIGEFSILKEFIKWLAALDGRVRLWYWSADRGMFNRALERHGVEGLDPSVDWMDMKSVFVEEPMGIPGCFDFGLKNIASALRSRGLISATIESNCRDGVQACIDAHHIYESGCDVTYSDVMRDIEKYNRFDCVVLGEIHQFLKSRV